MFASREHSKEEGPPLHCAQCHKHNPRENENCLKCNAPLWQICPHCKKRCPRTASRCLRCVEPLGIGMFGKIRRMFRRTIKRVRR